MKKRLLVLLTAGVLSLPAADKLLIIHKQADSLGIYDAATGKLETAIPTGAKPHEFAFSPDERLAYVTNYGADSYTETQPGGNTISIIDLVARKNIGQINLGEYHRPHGIERGRSGVFYVTTDFPAALLTVDAAKKRVVRAIKVVGQLPHMVAIASGEQKAWTADAGSGTVTVIDLKNRAITATVKVGGVPMGLALTKDEKRLFVATRTQNQVVWVDAVANYVQRRIGVFGQPVRLLLSLDEKLLLASLIESGEVAAIQTATMTELVRYPSGARSEGMSLAPDGRFFFIAAQGDNKVIKFRMPDLSSPAVPDRDPVLVFETAAKPDPSYTWKGPKL